MYSIYELFMKYVLNIKKTIDNSGFTEETLNCVLFGYLRNVPR